MGRFSAVDNGRSSITCMDLFSYDSVAVENCGGWVLAILRKHIGGMACGMGAVGLIVFAFPEISLSGERGENFKRERES